MTQSTILTTPIARDAGGSFISAIPVFPLNADGSAAGAGIFASASFVPAAATYLGGNIVSVAKEFAWADRNGVAVPSGALIRVLTSVMKIDEPAIIPGETGYTLQKYSVTPPSAQADNTAWARPSADLASYCGPISLGTPVAFGGTAYIKTQYVDTDIKLAGTSTWGELVTVGGATFTAVARQVLLYGVIL